LPIYNFRLKTLAFLPADARTFVKHGLSALKAESIEQDGSLAGRSIPRSSYQGFLN
jgi:hypothetical protein